MEQKKKLSVKDQITIHIKKTKPIKWQICLIISVILLIVLIVMSKVQNVKRKAAPNALAGNEVEFRATFTGDIQISDNIRQLANETGYTNIFEGVSKYWEKSNYVVANVSGPVLRYDVSHYTSTRDKNENSDYLRPAALRGMKKAGINLLCFANDDAFNYGRTGIKSTLSMLDEYKMDYIGIAASNTEPLYKTLVYKVKNKSGDKEDRTLAVIGVNDAVRKKSTVGENKEGIVNSSMVEVYEQIAQASKQNDYVIAYIHSGNGENVLSSEENHETFRAFVDAGANIVIGNSVSLQSVEQYNEGIIVYGLGNFVTDEVYSFLKDSAMMDFVIQRDGEVVLYFTPLRITEGHPAVAFNDMYMKRIQTILTKDLAKDSYTITEEGLIKISLGRLPEKVDSEFERSETWDGEER